MMMVRMRGVTSFEALGTLNVSVILYINRQTWRPMGRWHGNSHTVSLQPAASAARSHNACGNHDRGLSSDTEQ